MALSWGEDTETINQQNDPQKRIQGFSLLSTQGFPHPNHLHQHFGIRKGLPLHLVLQKYTGSMDLKQ